MGAARAGGGNPAGCSRGRPFGARADHLEVRRPSVRLRGRLVDLARRKDRRAPDRDDRSKRLFRLSGARTSRVPDTDALTASLARSRIEPIALQSKPTISTQFAPFPAGTFCRSLSAPLAGSIAETEIVSDFSPEATRNCPPGQVAN